jgi:hypothetical protein
MFTRETARAASVGRVGMLAHGATGRRASQRGLRRLRAQDQFLPLLVAGTLLTTLALVLIAYLTVRAGVLAAQQQQVTRDARIGVQMLAGSGGFALKNGQLVTLSATGQGTPSALAEQLAHIHDLTGERAALYTMQARGLVAVASDGLGAVGQPADATAVATLVGDCGPVAHANCYHTYSGPIYQRDGAYTAAFVPLFDPAGGFVGALGVGQPQSAVLAPAAQFTIVLLFVGLLVTLVVLAIGVWTCNLITSEVLDTLHLRLNHLATTAAELERAAQQQVAAAGRQERMARQITDGARDIDALVNTMTQGHLAMHDSATGVWAEMSQPGVAPDPAAAMRFARQAVVMAARVGVAAEDARARCNAVVRLMNQVIAEGHVLAGHGRVTQRRAGELRGVVEQVERALGEPVAPGATGAPIPSRLAPLSTLPPFAPPAEQGWLAQRWQTLRLSAGLLASRVGRALLERASVLAGRAAGSRIAADEALDAASDATASDATASDAAGSICPPGERAANTHPLPGLARPDEWYPQAETGRREPPPLPDLPRPPEHPRWRERPDDAGRPRDENDTQPRW